MWGSAETGWHMLSGSRPRRCPLHKLCHNSMETNMIPEVPDVRTPSCEAPPTRCDPRPWLERGVHPGSSSSSHDAAASVRHGTAK